MADRLLKGKRAVWMAASHLQCWIVDWDSFSGAWAGWEVRAGFRLCRKRFWPCNSIMFICLHCYLKWKFTSAGRMSVLLDLQLRPIDCQTYCCIWALNSFWQTFTRLHLLLENSYSTLFPTEPQSFWRFAIFCTNCFSLYGSMLNSEAK